MSLFRHQPVIVFTFLSYVILHQTRPVVCLYSFANMLLCPSRMRNRKSHDKSPKRQQTVCERSIAFHSIDRQTNRPTGQRTELFWHGKGVGVTEHNRQIPSVTWRFCCLSLTLLSGRDPFISIVAPDTYLLNQSLKDDRYSSLRMLPALDQIPAETILAGIILPRNGPRQNPSDEFRDRDR